MVGSTAAAVARALAAQDDPEAGERFRAIRERYAAGAANLALLDLDSVYRFADTHRAGLAQRLLNRAKPESNDAGRDLDQVLELVHLFRAAYLTSTLDPSFTSVHRTLGLVAQPGTAASPR
ncbi:MAG: hypothetical protein U0794_16585 [Isosphaeraceae bacterium]